MKDWDTARDDLRQAELALMHQREQVAQMRRDLPPGPPAGDYTFAGPDGPVSLRSLSTGEDRALVIYHFMFGGRQEHPCPMCSMWTDGWNAVSHHLAPQIDLALVTQGSVEENQTLVADRGWGNLHWLSAADTTFKLDHGSMDGDGNQWPFFTVFERDGDQLRLSWSGGANISGEHWRGVDLLSPVWHFFDLTRAGRGDWMPST
ncbi:MAG: DUF899 family protein [Actinomycetota bacterium]